MRKSHLRSHLMAFRRRLCIRDGLVLAQRTLWLAFVGTVCILILGRFAPIKGLKFWMLVPIIGWLCVVLMYTIFRPRPLNMIAQLVDLELELKERISTAYELEIENPAQFTNLQTRQHFDALSAARTITPHHAFPLHWLPRPILATIGILATALILVYLPNPMDAALAERAAVEKTIQEQAQKIEDLREDVEQSKELTPELQTDLLRQLEELVQQLSYTPGDREKALADLSSLEEELRRKLDLNTDLRQASLEAIVSQLESLTTQDDDRPLALNEALEQIASEVANISEAEQQELAEDLAQMAAQAAQSGDQALAKTLASMSQAALSGDSVAASEAANEISDALSQAQGDLNDQQALQQALAQLQNSSQAVAQAGQTGQQIADQGLGQSNQGDNPGQGNNPGQRQNGQGTSGGTKADTLPPGSGSGRLEQPEDIDTGVAVGDLGEQVYIPWERRPREGEAVSIPGQDTGEGETITRDTPNPSGGLPGPALIPYQDVYTQYVEAAQQAINNNNVPAAYRALVRDYFTHLEP